MTTKISHDRLLRDIDHEISHFAHSLSKQPPPKPPAPLPTAHLLSDVSIQPLTWLWPGRIPLGHLTLLDAAPGSGLSLVALTLAACVSSGSPLPDGTPVQQGNVILFAPYDSYADTLKPRLQAAGGDPAHVVLLRPLVKDASPTLAGTRSFAFPHDLDHLLNLIISQNACLVIIDPASAIPGLSRCLPALIEIANKIGCSILLTRSLRQSPADPLHSPGSTSPLLQAASSRLLLAPDPADDRRHLLLTTKHRLCTQPGILAYDILASEAGIPAIHWLGERDRSHLARLSTAPLRSPQRQAILRFLLNSASPHSIPEILEAASYDKDAGRKMLRRMNMAGELVSPARGLYTTANHPCLVNFPNNTPPVPNVTTVPSPALATSPQSDIPPAPTTPVIDHINSTIPPLPSPALATSPQSNVPPIPDISVTDHATNTMFIVQNVPSPAHGTGEVAQQHIDTSPVSLESVPQSNGTSRVLGEPSPCPGTGNKGDTQESTGDSHTTLVVARQSSPVGST